MPTATGIIAMRDIVSIHIGQCGIQAGQATWDLLCREHGCGADGLPVDSGLNRRWDSIFFETDVGKLIPRAVLADLEPGVCDQIRRGPTRFLYHPDQLVSGRSDSANNYARGRLTAGRSIIQSTTEQLRRCAERSESLQGVVLYQALGGGTGSGFGALLLDHIADEYGKATRMQLALFPSAHVTSAAVEPYNAVLGLHATLEAADLTILLDNESLYDLAVRNLHLERPSFVHVNRLISQVLSSMTVSDPLSASDPGPARH
jgi:tubulin alpha